MVKLPTYDLTPEELPSYTGTNPRPDDFDQYWQDALDELAAIPADPKMEEAEISFPGVRCYHFTFTGIGGARVYAKFLRPDKAGSAGQPGMLHFHGYSGRSGDWMQYYSYAALGFFVLAMDCRGQAGLSEDSGHLQKQTLRGHIVRGVYDDPRQLRFRSIFTDTHRLASLMADFPEVDHSRLVATGGSQGGGLSLACAGLYPDIARMVIWNPFLCDYQRVWELGLSEEGAYQEIGDIIRKADPRGERLSELFHNLGYIDASHLAARVQATTLMVTGLADTVCPPSTQFAAFNRIQGEKSYVFYPLHGHEPIQGIDDLAYRHWADLIN